MEALTIPVTLYIHVSAPHVPALYLVHTCDMSQNYPDLYVLLETRTVCLEINQPEPIDIIGKQVERLQKEKASIVDRLTSVSLSLKTRFSSCCASTTPNPGKRNPF
jgi:hypothetical protein